MAFWMSEHLQNITGGRPPSILYTEAKPPGIQLWTSGGCFSPKNGRVWAGYFLVRCCYSLKSRKPGFARRGVWGLWPQIGRAACGPQSAALATLGGCPWPGYRKQPCMAGPARGSRLCAAVFNYARPIGPGPEGTPGPPPYGGPARAVARAPEHLRGHRRSRPPRCPGKGCRARQPAGDASAGRACPLPGPGGCATGKGPRAPPTGPIKGGGGRPGPTFGGAAPRRLGWGAGAASGGGGNFPGGCRLARWVPPPRGGGPSGGLCASAGLSVSWGAARAPGAVRPREWGARTPSARAAGCPSLGAWWPAWGPSGARWRGLCQ